MQPTLLVAIGGHALVGTNASSRVANEPTQVKSICDAVAELAADGWRIVVTHGNGPQVGAALARSEAAIAEAYPLPLDVCVACTQGEIGLLLQRALEDALDAKGIRRPVATVLSQVLVESADPAFSRPTKPIGPYYSRLEAPARQARGWIMIEDARGWRRVVPSPEPIAIVEEPVIHRLVEANVLVIALGGGGIPVVRRNGRLVGVEAVVDKDLSSALLATHLRADRLVLATDVDRAYLDFGTSMARGLDGVSVEELQRHAEAGHFPAGSMGPKVEAALRFVKAGGIDAIVTSYDQLTMALQGRAGTRVELAAHAGAGERGFRGMLRVTR